MSHLPTPEPLYLAADPDPVFVTLHRTPAPGPGTAVLLCPPFGWEEICAYRSLRRWAELLAAAGHPTVRVTFPGTGDSGGSPRDPDRLGAWTAAVSEAATWLRHETGARRLAAVGIGLGGVVAALAAAGGGEIDDLALWATPARGKALIRQLKAFSRLERSLFYEGAAEPPPAPRDGDELEAGGFVLTAETVAALGAVDLGDLQLPHPDRRRALLLERDGLPVDEALRERLEGLGVAVTVAPGDGFAEMTSGPQTARTPGGVVERVRAWLDEAPAVSPGTVNGAGAPAVPDAGRGAAPGAGPAADPSAEIRGDGPGIVRETVLSIPQRSGELAAVLAEPADHPRAGVVLVLLNAGAVRRIGPSRLWVEVARRWAARGVPVVRLDVEAIGDAEGDETPYRRDAALYEPWFVPQVVNVIDFLQARGLGGSFVLGGLCSGAYWAFQAALGDPRVSGVVMLNPRALVWSAGIGPQRDLRALLTQRPSMARFRRTVTGTRLTEFLRWLASAPVRIVRRLWARESPGTVLERRLDGDLAALVASGRRMCMLFSDREPLHDELERTGRLARLATAPNVAVERVHVRDHTMRPVWAQRQVHDAVDRALAREPAVRAAHVAGAASASPESPARPL